MTDPARDASGRIAEGATARSAAYALFSQLVASPFDAPGLAAALPPVDLPEAAEQLRAQLPYGLDLEPLATAAAELDEADAERLARDYSALFEVGSPAQVPIREELAQASSEKAKEETLRFYDFFGYVLADERQWAPDHLSVQLEFLHFLAFRESREGDVERRASYRLAQRDYLERHLTRWFPEVLEGVRGHSRETWWRTLFETLDTFLRADAAWQRQTLAEER